MMWDLCKEMKLQKAQNVHLYISAPTQYAIRLNGRLVDLGQYGDFPYYKVYPLWYRK